MTKEEKMKVFEVIEIMLEIKRLERVIDELDVKEEQKTQYKELKGDVKMTNEEKVKVLKSLFGAQNGDGDKYVDFRDLDFGDWNVNFGGISAKHIFNYDQKAIYINNSGQHSTNSIDNCHQDAGDKIWNEHQKSKFIHNHSQTAKYEIENTSQKSNYINRNHQTCNFYVDELENEESNDKISFDEVCDMLTESINAVLKSK